MNIFRFSRLSILLMQYGFFAVICHSVGICLYASLLPPLSDAAYYAKIFPLLEHSLMSFVAILFGVLGIEYIYKNKDA